MGKRPVKINGNTALIELSNGDFSIIDASYADAASEWNWTALQTASGHVYAKRTHQNKSLMLHREIMGVTDSKVYVDHIDGNTLNNTKGNLRLATPSENRRNQVLSISNTTGFKGVSKRCNGFVAQIQCDGVVKYLGIFQTKEEAHACYCGAAMILHGDYWCNGVRR